MFNPIYRRRLPSGVSVQRRSGARRPTPRSRRIALESLEPRQMMSATPDFQVFDDATANKAFHYSENGTPLGSFSLTPANSAPRGAASMIADQKMWVVDANRKVYVYDTSGALKGSWSTSMANNAKPEGIATNGTDVWIVDNSSDRVFRYAGAASRLSGSQAAASSFNLSSGNSSPKGMVTDGASMWVVDDAKNSDRVFKYSITGSYVGSWTIDPANKTPTGIALDPANIGDMWISDSGTDRVYKYAAATSRSSGSQPAASNFALTAGNGNSQGLVVPGRPWAETPYAVEWVRQFGTAADDWGRGVVTDAAGYVYVSGVIDGVLSGMTVGTPYVAKFNSSGDLVWRQEAVGQINREGVNVATDALGNVFQTVGPSTDGSGPLLNNYDSSSGTLKWTTHLPSGEYIFSVTTDDLGRAYMSSYVWEGSIFVRQFDAQTGLILWQRQVATGGTNNSSGISADHMGNIYVAAYTSGSLLGSNAGSSDAVLIKLSDAGDVLWTRQFGTPQNDYGFKVSTDSFGNAYISGYTMGSLGGPNVGDQDNFLAKFDANGNQLWTRQFGTSGSDTSSSSWIDPAGNIYRAMTTTGALGGVHHGGSDIVVVKYDPSGNISWAKQLGTSSGDGTGGGIWGDAQGNLYIAGSTQGSLEGANAGGVDAVLIKLAPPVNLGDGAGMNLTSASSSGALVWVVPNDPERMMSSAASIRAMGQNAKPLPEAGHVTAADGSSMGNAGSVREWFFASFGLHHDYASPNRGLRSTIPDKFRDESLVDNIFPEPFLEHKQ